ncbi:MAG TPA: DUF1579 domain-containing protein [Candidatus Binatia bacterium]|nr:DUF1579 domain-containing protein [Candidatus Binatia bacterium]
MEPRSRFAPALLAAALIALTWSAPALAADKTPSKAKAKTTADAKAAADAKATQTAAEADAAKSAAAQPSKEEMMAMMMKMATPGPEHAALNPLAGSWKTVTKMWSDPSAEPTSGEGTCERSWVMGGRYLVANYKGVFGTMPFEGMEVLGYDNMKKQYVSSWVDNMGTGIMLSQGPAMEPATHSYTLTGTMADPTGRESTMREVTNIVDGNTYTMTMYANDKGQEQKMMEITYSRAK